MKKFLYLLLVIINSLNAGKNFVLVGPPGSGKRTFSSFMCQSKNYKQIYLSNINEHQIKEELESCIKKNINFVILDFPRNINELYFLKNLLSYLDQIDNTCLVHFLADDATCLSRLKNRLICSTCKSTYNFESFKPIKNNICDICANKLETSHLDSLEATKLELSYYRSAIEPLVNVAKDYFLTLTFNANLPFQDCSFQHNWFYNLY